MNKNTTIKLSLPWGLELSQNMLEFKVKYIQENCVKKVVGKFAEVANNPDVGQDDSNFYN